MSKKTKILFSSVIAALAVVLIILGVILITDSSEEDSTETTATTQQEDDEDQAQGDTVTQTDEEETTQQTLEISEQIIGKWRDSANISGYEFYEDGSVDITYVDLTLPILNIPIEGTVTGNYSLSDNKITISYSLYTQTFDESYTITIEDNVLKLTSFGEVSTYSKVVDTQEETTEQVVYEDDELTGTWVNSNGSIEYTFNEDGIIDIDTTSDSYSGIYFIQDDEMSIQYVLDNEIITENYTYVVSKNSMSLTDSDSAVSLWVRSGTEFDTGSINAEDLLGSWEDSTGMTGYTFNEGNIVDITYANFTIPVLNIPITGTYKGVYVAGDGTLTMNYTISSQSYSYTYTFSVDGDVLTLTNTDDGEVSVYTKVS